MTLSISIHDTQIYEYFPHKSTLKKALSGIEEKQTTCAFYDFENLRWSDKGCFKDLENSGNVLIS